MIGRRLGSLLTVVLASALLPGCRASVDEGPTPSTSTTSTSTTTSGGTGPVADGGSTSTGQVRLDLPPPEEMACQKIDFLFVIDNSGSMEDEQERLIAGFPGFIEAIQESISQYDYHLMVVTVDDQPPPPPPPPDPPGGTGTTGDPGGSSSGDTGGTTDGGGTTGMGGTTGTGSTTGMGGATDTGGTGGTTGMGGTTDTGDTGGMGETTGGGFEPDPCGGEFGAGRVVASDGSSCGLPKGQRYADIDREDLTAVFSCIADVGTNGSGAEKPVWSLAQALTEQTLPGECNEGFLRDDAILVVTIITDEEDDMGVDSPGEPAIWKDVIVSAKYGDETAIVMLGLLGDTDLDDAVCEPYDFNTGDGAQGAPRLRELVESFPRGSWASVCLRDYAPFFNAAVVDIGEACEEFTPPG